MTNKARLVGFVEEVKKIDLKDGVYSDENKSYIIVFNKEIIAEYLNEDDFILSMSFYWWENSNGKSKSNRKYLYKKLEGTELLEKLKRYDTMSNSKRSESNLKSKHRKYINSKEWKIKRKQKLDEYGYHCDICGSEENLHVHHLHYNNFEHEEMCDLQVLCKKCHSKIHKKY